jgi:hypothetical protein
MTQKTDELINLLLEHKDSPVASQIADMLGLQLVHRNGSTYIRRIPVRLTGYALDSALKFAQINHKNRGKSGVVILPSGVIQNKVAFDSAREMAHIRVKREETEKERIIALMKHNDKTV